MKYPLHSLLIAASLGFLGINAQATERHFAFTYETTTLPKGAAEFEQQFVWERGSGSNTFLFRHEIEYGITDKLQLSVYLYDFEHARVEGAHSTTWAGSGLEVVYQLSDPNRDFIGSALYLEGKMNDRDLELEGKILLQKNFGPLMLVYNGVIEAHWENRYTDAVGDLEQLIGVSYQIHPSFSVGFEAKHEVEFVNWSHSGGNAVFVGPNVSFRKGAFFAAASCLFRVSDVVGEPHIEFGTVLGFLF